VQQGRHVSSVQPKGPKLEARRDPGMIAGKFAFGSNWAVQITPER